MRNIYIYIYIYIYIFDYIILIASKESEWKRDKNSPVFVDSTLTLVSLKAPKRISYIVSFIAHS